MKRFQFRLQSLLRIREQRERQSELELLKALGHWELCRARVAELERRLNQTAEAMVGRWNEPGTALAWMARADHAVLLGEAIKAAEAAVHVALKHLQSAKQVRAKAHREVEALRTLQDKQRELHQRESERRTQNQLDDLGLRRWQQQGEATAEALRTGREHFREDRGRERLS